jgi:hypothetical protein
LRLAARLSDRLALAPGELRDDAVAGGVAIAMRRAAVFGRAPVLPDLELAFTLAGYLGDPPADLVAWRVASFKGIAHDRWAERELAAAVPESTLRLTAAAVAERPGEWRELVGAGDGLRTDGEAGGGAGA